MRLLPFISPRPKNTIEYKKFLVETQRSIEFCLFWNFPNTPSKWLLSHKSGKNLRKRVPARSSAMCNIKYIHRIPVLSYWNIYLYYRGVLYGGFTHIWSREFVCPISAFFTRTDGNIITFIRYVVMRIVQCSIVWQNMIISEVDSIILSL